MVEGSQCNGAFMENKTGFCLTEEVEFWRAGLAARETIFFDFDFGDGGGAETTFDEKELWKLMPGLILRMR